MVSIKDRERAQGEGEEHGEGIMVHSALPGNLGTINYGSVSS